jgi:predicted nucleic acid-binding protein
MLVSVPLMLEYEAVLTRDEHLFASKLTMSDVGKALDNIASFASHIRLACRWRPVLTDANDDMVLETAMNGSADAIVTFNVHDFASAGEQFDLDFIQPNVALQRLRSFIP